MPKEGLSKDCNIDSNLIEEMVSNELDTSRSKVGYRQMSEIVNLRYKDIQRVGQERIKRGGSCWRGRASWKSVEEKNL